MEKEPKSKSDAGHSPRVIQKEGRALAREELLGEVADNVVRKCLELGSRDNMTMCIVQVGNADRFIENTEETSSRVGGVFRALAETGNCLKKEEVVPLSTDCEKVLAIGTGGKKKKKKGGQATTTLTATTNLGTKSSINPVTKVVDTHKITLPKDAAGPRFSQTLVDARTKKMYLSQ